MITSGSMPSASRALMQISALNTSVATELITTDALPRDPAAGHRHQGRLLSTPVTS